MIVLYVLLALVGLIVLFLLLKLVQLFTGNKRAEIERENLADVKLSSFGSVKNLSVLPLIDFYAAEDGLATEAGVSYLIKADDTTILMDVGLNKQGEHPSPLLRNMEKLGVSPDDADMIYITHLHLDHVGGMKEQRTGTFSLSRGPVELSEIPAYLPVEMAPSEWNPGPVPNVSKEPRVLGKGIVSMGTIPRNLFLVGMTYEQNLAFNVEGKGIVLVIGCGHQTAERIVERAKAMFDEPIYGVIGGLHFPVHGGRLMIGPLEMQSIVGSDRVPWDGISEDDVNSAIDAIESAGPKYVSLSAHDSSDWALDRFRQAFGERYHDLKVGEELKINV